MLINDIFGCQKKLKDILPRAHFTDIRVRLNGKYYWFQGDFLKDVFRQVEFKKTEKECLCNLSAHEETT